MNRKARDKYVQTQNPFPVTSCGRRRSFQTTSTPKKLNSEESPMKGKISPACKRAAKRKFKVWPSAYASGWGVRCTRNPSKYLGKKKK